DVVPRAFLIGPRRSTDVDELSDATEDAATRRLRIEYTCARMPIGGPVKSPTTSGVRTPFISQLPPSTVKGHASPLPITVYRPPFELPAISILQLWHARSDADPGSSLLRTIIRQVGKGARA